MTETLDVVPGRWFAVFFYSPDRRGENLEGHLTTFDVLAGIADLKVTQLA